MQGRQRRSATGAACPCIMPQTVPAATPRAGRQAAAVGGAGGERSEPPASITRGGERGALCAARKPGYIVAAWGGCNVGTPRRGVMPSTCAMVRQRASRRARCARWAGYQLQHRAAPTRPGRAVSSLIASSRLAYSEPGRLIDSNLAGYTGALLLPRWHPRRCCSKALLPACRQSGALPQPPPSSKRLTTT